MSKLIQKVSNYLGVKNNNNNNNNANNTTNFSIVLSAHGDTNWHSHSLEIHKAIRKYPLSPTFDTLPKDVGEFEEREEVEYYGHMDNFAGVNIVMQSYFSARLPIDPQQSLLPSTDEEKEKYKPVRIEITYAEETTMEGAREVAKTLTNRDIVIVLDVTGTPTHHNFTIEKCYNKRLRDFVVKELRGKGNFKFDMYVGCPDPIANQDETNVYSKYSDFTFFFGIPTRGGDYNDGPVRCWKSDIDQCVEAIIFLCNSLQSFHTLPVDNSVDLLSQSLESDLSLFPPSDDDDEYKLEDFE